MFGECARAWILLFLARYHFAVCSRAVPGIKWVIDYILITNFDALIIFYS